MVSRDEEKLAAGLLRQSLRDSAEPCPDAEILAAYLRQADEIDPGVRHELAEMLNPTSNHTWRLEARYRFLGKPTKEAKHGKSVFNEVTGNLTKLLSGTDPLDPRCQRATCRYA